MSEVFKINTEDAVKVDYKAPPPTQIYQLVGEDNPILKEVLPEVDFSTVKLSDMNHFASCLVETCRYHKGYGLAANQCGFKIRCFVMGADENYVAHFNPKVLRHTAELVQMKEGCLSFPLLGLNVLRPKQVVVEYQDFNGEKHTATYDGLSARIFQHELDHLDGIVYTQRAKPLALKSGMDKRRKLTKTLTRNVAIKKQTNVNTNRPYR
jgi:peptide deformylase